MSDIGVGKNIRVNFPELEVVVKARITGIVGDDFKIEYTEERLVEKDGATWHIKEGCEDFIKQDSSDILLFEADNKPDPVDTFKISSAHVGDCPAEESTEGLRFNEGKTRHDLLPPYAQEQYAKVMTKGAEKYAERNWEKGMDWTKVLASMKRHILAFERGEDFDPETGVLHMAHVMCNAAFLTEYYKVYPQGDDRPHEYLRETKIGLDVDDVLADFITSWSEKEGHDIPTAWSFDREMMEKLDASKNDKDFWMDIPVKTKPEDLPFEPHCYITSRPIPTEWTEEWLDKHGFPAAPVHTVQPGEDKVEIATRADIDIFVDDSWKNFVQLNRGGICTYLFTTQHNKRYNVGHKRIDSLKDLFDK